MCKTIYPAHFRKCCMLYISCVCDITPYNCLQFEQFTVKPVLTGHSLIYKTKVVKTSGSLMKVNSIAECSLGAFCNTFDLH